MRTSNSIKNILFALVGQVVGMIISFIARLVFVRLLSAEYLGVNGLFTDVLSILSLAELGFGTAIIYGLYKPLANKDEKKIKAWINFYASVYKLIGIVVLILGLCILPFLDIIIKNQPDIPYLNLIYILFLINSVITYFFAHKQSLIIADQKNYIVTFYNRIFSIMVNIIQIIVLFLTKNFILYLIVKIIFSLLENIVIARRADKMYPFLKEKNNEQLTEKERKNLFKNIQALFYHKLGGVAVQGTDNILISSFVGIVWVGLYSNYLLIIISISSIISKMFESVTASIGNLNVSESKNKSFEVYKGMLFVNFWLYGFSSISLWILFNPFITIWLGSEYIMSKEIVAMIVLNFYVKGMRQSTGIFKNSFGLFWNDRYKPLAELVVNLTVSVLLAQQFGIIGVLIGTFVSTMTTVFWIEPYVLYKHGFQKNVKDYFKSYIYFAIALITAAIPTWLISNLFNNKNLASFIGQVIACIIIPNFIILIIFHRTTEFKYVLKILKSIFKKNS